MARSALFVLYIIRLSHPSILPSFLPKSRWDKKRKKLMEELAKIEEEMKANDCTSERRSELEKAHEALQREAALMQTGGRGMYVRMVNCFHIHFTGSPRN